REIDDVRQDELRCEVMGERAGVRERLLRFGREIGGDNDLVEGESHFVLNDRHDRPPFLETDMTLEQGKELLSDGRHSEPASGYARVGTMESLCADRYDSGT